MIANPKGLASGTRMSFAGEKDPQHRADILAYLQTLSESPVPFPAEGAAKEAPKRRRPGQGRAGERGPEKITGLIASGLEPRPSRLARPNGNCAMEPARAAAADDRARDLA